MCVSMCVDMLPEAILIVRQSVGTRLLVLAVYLELFPVLI